MRHRKRLAYLLGLSTGLLVTIGLSGAPAQAATPAAHAQSVITGGWNNWGGNCDEDSWDGDWNGSWGDNWGGGCGDNGWGSWWNVGFGGNWGGGDWGHHHRRWHHRDCDDDDD